MTVASGACGPICWPTPLAFLYSVAMETGIRICDYPGGDPRVGGDIAAIVAGGTLIALNSDLTDDGLHADVLAMAREVATVMTDRPDDRPGTVYAPGGFVAITGTRVPPPAAGVGRFATLMARKFGRDTASAAFEYRILRVEYHTPEFPGDGH